MSAASKIFWLAREFASAELLSRLGWGHSEKVLKMSINDRIMDNVIELVFKIALRMKYRLEMIVLPPSVHINQWITIFRCGSLFFPG